MADTSIWRHRTTQNVAYNVAGGASTQSNAFGSQTYAIRVSIAGFADSTNNGARISVGDNPTRLGHHGGTAAELG